MPKILDATVMNQLYDTEGNGGRKLVMLENGWLVAGALETRSSNYFYIQLYISKDNGNSFTHLAEIPVQTTTNSILKYFSLTTDGKYIFVAYNNAIRDMSVKVATVNSEGVVIGGVALTSYGSYSHLGTNSIVANKEDSTIHLAISDKNVTYGQSFNIRYVKGTILSDGSVIWGNVEQVTTVGSSSYDKLNPSIVLDGNGVPLIIFNTSGSYYHSDTDSVFSGRALQVIKRDRTLPNTGSSVDSKWSQKTVYIESVNSTHIQYNPSAIYVPTEINGLPNGRIWVAWYGTDSTDNTAQNIRLSYSDDGGVSWSAMQKLTSGNAYSSLNPSLTVNKRGDIFVIFNQHSPVTNYSNMVSMFYNGVEWSEATTIKSINASASTYPSTLHDLTIDFTSPPLIYSDVVGGKLGFYGDWIITEISVPKGFVGIKADGSNLLTYSITTEGKMSPITEKINGEIIATKNAVDGENLTVTLTPEQWDKVLYRGTNTLVIEMGLNEWEYTFNKQLGQDSDMLSITKAIQDSNKKLVDVKAELVAKVGGDISDSFGDIIENGYYGRKIATGSGLIGSSNTMSFYRHDNNTISSNYLQVSGLDFDPKFVMVYQNISNYVPTFFIKDGLFVYNGIKSAISFSGMWIQDKAPVSSLGGFLLPTGGSVNNGVLFNWIAIGD